MKTRTYAKRTKSTGSKTYKDYQAARKALEAKGYELKSDMSKASFEAYYKRLQNAKRAGEIKSGAWQTLMSKEKYVSTKQAKALAKAASVMEGRKITALDIRKSGADKIAAYGAYLNEHKREEALYGSNYE